MYANSLQGVFLGGLAAAAVYQITVFITWLFGSILFVLLAKNTSKTRLVLTVIFSAATLLFLICGFLDLQDTVSDFTEPNPFLSGIVPMLLDVILLVGYSTIFSKYNIKRAFVISALLFLTSIALAAVLVAV